MAWIDGITNNLFPESFDSALIAPYPDSVWRIDPEVNGGYPFIPLMPDLIKIHVEPVDQLPYISVYDIHTSQLEFTRNGLAILQPISCDVSEELSGMWSISMVCPMDEDGKYQYLVVGNIVKVLNQLFTIKKTDEQIEGNHGTVSVYAEHIFYQLCDEWIYSRWDNPLQLVGRTGQDFLSAVMSAKHGETMVGGQSYVFTASSNLKFVDNPLYFFSDEGCTPVECILGEGGIIACRGGELHRDNFYFSVNERKEGAQDNAFCISYGKNLKSVKRTIDTTSMCTFFGIIDSDTGGGIAIAWVGILPGMKEYLPHHVIREKHVSYPDTIQDRWKQLENDLYKYWYQNCMPIISYDIEFEDIRRYEEYDVCKFESIRVGDSGKVVDMKLGEIQLEITRTVTDALTGRVKSIQIGSQQSLVYHPNIPNVFGLSPKIESAETWVSDSTGRYLYDSTGRKIIVGA